MACLFLVVPWYIPWFGPSTAVSRNYTINKYTENSLVHHSFEVLDAVVSGVAENIFHLVLPKDELLLLVHRKGILQ